MAFRKKHSVETKKKLMIARSKIPSYVVVAIRFCYDCGMCDRRELAAIFKVSPCQISNIIHNHTYTY